MLKTIRPNSTLLQKYIDFFYIYSSVHTSKFSYLAFPHYNTGLSFFKGVEIKRAEFEVAITESPNTNVKLEILGKYTRPVNIQYTGKIEEISIIFKPLGINRFFSEDFNALAPRFTQPLENKVWKNFAENLCFEENDLQNLELFLLSKFKQNIEFSRLERSLPLLNELRAKDSLKEIASRLGYNLKTFQRHFNKYMGCSPIEYRRICRFRNSLTSKLNSSELKNLTDITYEEGYYDQSYFIKEFRKLTNHNPKDFFKSTSKVDGDKIVWELK